MGMKLSADPPEENKFLPIIAAQLQKQWLAQSKNAYFQGIQIIANLLKQTSFIFGRDLWFTTREKSENNTRRFKILTG